MSSPHPDEMLHSSIVSCDVAGMLHALELGANVNATNSAGLTPLMQAVNTDAVPEVFTRLVDAGANVNAGSNSSASALLMAAKKCRPELCLELLNWGAEVQSRDAREALLCAARAGHVELAQMLKSACLGWSDIGLDPLSVHVLAAAAQGAHKAMCAWLIAGTSSVPGLDAILPAVQCNHATACRTLLEAGLRVDAKAANNALIFAASKGLADACKVLIENSGDVNVRNGDGETILMLAAQHGHVRTCEVLIQLGADLRATVLEDDGADALLIAAEYGHAEVCRLLVTCGADVNGPWGLETAMECPLTCPLYVALEYGRASACKMLVQHGASPEPLARRPMRATWFAARHGFPNILERVLKQARNDKYDFDVDVFNSGGYTPLMVAAARGHADVCHVLLRYGASVEMERQVTDDWDEYGDRRTMHGWTALSAAAGNGHAEVCELLLKDGLVERAPEPFIEEELSQCLIDAVEAGYANVCRVLLEHGADANAAKPKGETALMVAAQRGDGETCKLLIAHGACGLQGAGEWSFSELASMAEHPQPSDIFDRNVTELRPPALLLAAEHDLAEVCEDLLQEPECFERAVCAALSFHKRELCCKLLDITRRTDRHHPAMLMVAAHVGVLGQMLAQNVGEEPRWWNIDVIDDNYPGTALMLAAKNGMLQACVSLLEHGADIDAQDSCGMTALITCVASIGFREHKLDVCKALIQHGADVNTVADDGHTALTSVMDRWSFYGNELGAVAFALLDSRRIDVRVPGHLDALRELQVDPFTYAIESAWCRRTAALAARLAMAQRTMRDSF